VRSAWSFADGGFRMPDQPGIGVEVDEAALARFVVADG
jgi:L-alanine-DL-glutamate epimerase-like enolase superfamily enzyme